MPKRIRHYELNGCDAAFIVQQPNGSLEFCGSFEPEIVVEGQATFF